MPPHRATTATGRPDATQFTGCHLSLPDRFGATGAKVVVDLFVRKNEEQPFANRHGLSATAAKKTAGTQAFELPAHVTALKPSSPK